MYSFQIEVYTQGLIITGSYDLPLYRRVSDALNSGLHRYITLRDATIAPISHPQHAKSVQQMLVDWGRALLVATLVEPTPPPEVRAAETAKRDTQPMMFFTDAFAVRGNFYKRPDLDLEETLNRITEPFVSISDVHIFPHSGVQAVQRQFACLNREYLHGLYVVGASTMPVVTPSAEPIPPPVAPVDDQIAPPPAQDGSLPPAEDTSR